MARESKRDKALRYLAEDRVTVVFASEYGIRLSVRGSRAEPYTVRLGNRKGRLITECSCANGTEYHPVRPRCCHLAIAELLWRS